jgi:phosphoglucosamine mutase
MLSAALAAGLSSEGGQVLDLGVIPTPALAYLAQSRKHPAAMVSASHNPFFDNGIKLISASGLKLPDALEREIEQEVDHILSGKLHTTPPTGANVGEVRSDSDGLESYEKYLRDVVTLPGTRTLRVVCDCANGAASVVAPRVLSSAGFELHVIGAKPDGVNINEGVGSTDTSALAAAVRAHQADVGIAFDGDADRCIAIDENGEVVDGDRLIAMFALDLASRGQLKGNGVVVTVMSNLGLRRALDAAGIEVLECAVGDRNIIVTLEDRALCFGGEQSGHIIFFDDATTGDGLLTALKLLELLGRSGVPLSRLAASAMTRLPQELRTIHVTDPARYLENAAIASAIREVEAQLGATGRLLVRASGTEPAVRVMVEAEHAEVATEVVERLAALVREELS